MLPTQSNLRISSPVSSKTTPELARGFALTPAGRIHYASAGHGTPVVLLHMSPRSWTAYRRVIPILARSHHVIAMDTLGFGDSDDPPRSFGIPDYASSVVGLMDSIGVDRAHIWGSMTGSRIASELAAGWPERVRKLVLMGFPLFAGREQQRARIETAKEEQWWVPREDGSHLLRMWQHALYGFGKDIPVALAPTEIDPIGWQYALDYIADGVRAGDGYLRAALTVYEHDPRPALRKITAPTLVIGLAGERMREHIAGIGRAQAVGALIEDSRVVLLESPQADCRATYYLAESLVELTRTFFEDPDS
ncbi:MAG: alpha/beta hydrolase [Chloroflexota bacterium]